MLSVNILNQMDVDELRNYIHKQDVVLDYYKTLVSNYDAEIRCLEAAARTRTDRFQDTMKLDAARAVINDIEYDLSQKYSISTAVCNNLTNE